MLSFFQRNREDNQARTEQGVKRSRERWFGRILDVLRSSDLDEAVWEELEEILISADVGVEASLRIIEDLKTHVQDEGISDADTAFDRLKASLVQDLQADDGSDAWQDFSSVSSPYVILVVGVNGVGKTTSIAKLAHHFTREGKKVVLGAADTFRAAAEEQLEILGDRVGVEVISHQPGADPGAVAYDAYQASRARGADVLIVDTAGRLHTRTNLMEELKKVHRVLNRLDSSAPQQVILTLDATTGLNGLAQAQAFTQAVGCTGIFLAKLDGTARGGIALAIKHELNVPILFIGTGESLEDIAPFDATQFVDSLLAPVP
ncbi:MAG: signal recognition particle-docking protein FtsY [Chloroflexi bacterium]|nr:signal recognition particle-docking protein FtsY [Chloroflexota bacterium]